ncbi:MAG: hypothetical protein ACOH1M_06740 [Rhodoglobus sp.]
MLTPLPETPDSWDWPSTVAAIAAVLALLGAFLTWIQRPRPNLLLSHFYIDDSGWHSEKDRVDVDVVVQNHGNGPAQSVTLWLEDRVTLDRPFMRTKASDFWATLGPGEAVKIHRSTLLEVDHGDVEFWSGAAGYAQFNGAKLRVEWTNSFGLRRRRTWDLDKEHRKMGRATRPVPVINDDLK